MTSYIKIRPIIYAILITILLCSFMFSYAINSISIALLVVFFWIDKKEHLSSKLRSLKKSPIVFLYTLFFISQLIGLLYSTNLQMGIKKVTQLLPVLLLPIVAITEKISKKHFITGIEFLKFFTLLVFSNYLIIHIFSENRGLNSFVLFVVNEKLNMSQFYLAIIVLIPFLHSIYELLHKKQILYNAFFAVTLFFCLLILQNKTTILILGLILTIQCVLFLKQRFSLLKSTGVTVMMITVLALVILSVPGVKNKFEIIAKTTDFDLETIITKNKVTHTKNTIEHRFLINHIALKEIKNTFPLGVGTGDYLDALYKNYNELEFKVGKAEKLNNHNQYLSEFLKTGILGGLCFVVIIFLLFKSASFSDVFFLYLILFFGLACLFESYLDRQYGVMIFSFILPLFLSFEKTKNIDF